MKKTKAQKNIIKGINNGAFKDAFGVIEIAENDGKCNFLIHCCRELCDEEADKFARVSSDLFWHGTLHTAMLLDMKKELCREFQGKLRKQKLDTKNCPSCKMYAAWLKKQRKKK